MGEVRRYPHGTFCWVDLGTADEAGARVFYGAILGWSFEDVDGYTLCRMDGKEVAGIHLHDEPDAPPALWSSSLAVDDLDGTLARARDGGAAVRMEPFEQPGTARMAVIHDPAGAEVTLWQATGFPGARLVNERGAWSWNDLSTRDPAAAEGFYRDLFGWSFQRVAPGYWSISMGELLIGGMRGMEEDPPGTPANWMPYFVVAQAEEAARRVSELGGAVIVPPRDVPAGRFLVAGDPVGAICAFLEMGPDGPARGVDFIRA